MIRLLFFVISFACCFAFATEQEVSGRSWGMARQLGADIENGRLAYRTNQALGAMIEVGGTYLRKKGFNQEADELEHQWRTEFDGMIIRIAEDRNIGDHPTEVLSTWLALAYEMLEAKLGFELCQLLHLTDIKTVNFAVKIVFRPCTFPMDAVEGDRMTEYRRHFAGKCDGERYYGLVPVIAFWVTEIVCTAATWGTGAFFVCGPLAMGVEWVMVKFIAPKLSDRIYTRACGSWAYSY